MKLFYSSPGHHGAPTPHPNESTHKSLQGAGGGEFVFNGDRIFNLGRWKSPGEGRQ